MSGRIGFFDCYSGASGDMVLSALVDAGLDAALLEVELRKLRLPGWHLEVEKVLRSGLAGTQLRFALDRVGAADRRLPEIEKIIQSSELRFPVQETALRIFRQLAAAEAQVHGISQEAVHFHEVGAVDAILDIVGAAIGLDALALDQVYASSLPVGTGSVQTAAGPLPLPAPATLVLAAAVAAPLRPAPPDVELVTPTGAAILTTVAQFSQPPMTVERVGVGCGSRELPWPNVLRLWVGASIEGELEPGDVTVIETNLDDCPPEQIGFAMERLFEAGALDVYFTPVQMKKNRPGVLLTVLAPSARAQLLAGTVLRETTSLGVRFHTSQRLMCPRRSATVSTPFGPVLVKIKTIDGHDVVCPEYEECARIARERRVPIGAVYGAVATASVPTPEQEA